MIEKMKILPADAGRSSRKMGMIRKNNVHKTLAISCSHITYF